MYNPMMRSLYSKAMVDPPFGNQPSPRKLGFPSVMNFNRINLPVEGLTEKITDMSNPKNDKGVVYDDDELGVLVEKQTNHFMDIRKTIFNLADDVVEAEAKLLDLKDLIKKESTDLSSQVHSLNMLS